MKGKLKFEMLTKLSDGTEVVLDGEFAVGTAVFTLNENGEKVAVLDETYELDGGFIFTTVDGKISEIAEEKPTEAPVEEVKVEVEVTPMDEMKASFEMKFAELEAKFKGLEDKLEKFIETQALTAAQAEAKQEFKKEKFEKTNLNVYETLNVFFNKK